MEELSLLGKNVLRGDAVEKVMGTASFYSDIKLQGMLHTKILRSPYPHAKILSIDTSAAEKLAGVRAVLTDKDVSQRPFTPVYFVPAQAKSMVQDFVIMSDRVRWTGQPVAAVAAVTVDIAEAALGLIDVEDGELPA